LLHYRRAVRDDSAVIDAVTTYITARPRHGFGLLVDTFRDQRRPWGKTVLWRIYCQLNLNLPRRGKKRLPDRIREPLAVPPQANETWSAAFMTDSLWHDRGMDYSLQHRAPTRVARTHSTGQVRHGKIRTTSTLL
jgi:putative transposase